MKKNNKKNIVKNTTKNEQAIQKGIDLKRKNLILLLVLSSVVAFFFISVFIRRII